MKTETGANAHGRKLGIPSLGLALGLLLISDFPSSAGCDGFLIGDFSELRASVTKISESGATIAQLHIDGPSGVLLALEITGTAINGVDYQTIPASVPSGTTLAIVPIPDTIVEGTETIQIRASYTSGNPCVPGWTSETITIQIVETPLVSLASALDNPSLVWITGGSAAWSGQTDVSRVGSSAAESGALLDGQESWLETMVIGPGVLAFWWKVSSEMDFDFLEFHVGGNMSVRISGEEGWQQYFVAIPAGTQTLRWRYVTDETTTVGQNRGWVDQVVFVADAGAPAIVVQPVSQRVGEGDTATFFVGASGAAPRAYQWFSNETNAIAGATGSVLTLASEPSSQAGNYRVVVSNAFGSVTSSVVSLIVTSNRPVDTILLYAENPATSPYLAALAHLGWSYQLVTNDAGFAQALAVANPAATLAVVDAPSSNCVFNALGAFANHGGRAVLSYWGLTPGSALAKAFQANAVQVMTTAQPLYDWGGSPLFNGISSPLAFNDVYITDGQAYEPIAGGQALAGFTGLPEANMAAIVVGHNGRTLLCGVLLAEAVSGSDAAKFAENQLFHVTVGTNPVAPIVLDQPASQIAFVGDQAVFQVTTASAQPVSYQWFFNSRAMSGAVDSTLTLSNVQLTNAGIYCVVASNLHGAATSRVAVLAVTTTPKITNILLYVDGFFYPSPFAAALQNLGRSYQSFNGLASFNQAVASANPDTTLVVVDWSWDYFTSSELANFVNSGGRAILQCWHESVEPSVAAAFKISVASSLATTIPAYDWGGSPLFAGVGSPFNFSDTLIYDGLKFTSLPGGVAVGGFSSTIQPAQAAVVIGNSNRTIIHGFVLQEATSSEAGVRFAQNEIAWMFPAFPSLIVEPQDQWVAPGGTAKLSASAAGSWPLSFQWYFNETNLIASATNATLTLTNVQSAQAGAYTVVASNVFGVVTSRLASLGLLLPPIIAEHPRSLTVAAGGPAVFTISATGSLPISYRWLRTGISLTNMILNEHTCSIVLPGVPLNGAGIYSVSVSNQAGLCTGGPRPGVSSNAYLTVVVPPTNALIAAGANVTFEARVVGYRTGASGPPRFEWQYRGDPLTTGTLTYPAPLTNFNSLTISNVQASQAGNYAFVLTDTAGNRTAFPFTLLTMPSQPALGLARVGPGLKISWDAPGYVLQESYDLADPNGWHPMDQISSGLVTITVGRSNAFYRLWKP